MLYDAVVVGGERLRELILLALLQEVEIQRLLDLLLTLHREQILGLVGIRREMRGHMLFRGGRTLQQFVKRGNLVIQRSHN